MVDVSLMADLLRAVAPGTRLVLVGDTNQLPSVGPGRVLGDLIDSGVVPSFELTKIKRQDPGRIVTNCHAIKAGRDCVFENAADDDMHFLERTDPIDVRQTICELVESRLPARGFDPMRDVQVISPLREKTELSCKAFNEVLQRTLNRAEPVPKCRFKPGDKVMQTRNAVIDDQPVVNGDVGYVREITKKHIEVAFESPERLVRIPRRDNNLELAFAYTIHKSQGSEMPVVVIPVHRCFGSRMMQRNLVYTAISRAKELCVLVGERSALSAAIRRNHHQKRMSRLSELLARETGE
jgi:exodeoxyribonuclease V alpha subunit